MHHSESDLECMCSPLFFQLLNLRTLNVELTLIVLLKWRAWEKPVKTLVLLETHVPVHNNVLSLTLSLQSEVLHAFVLQIIICLQLEFAFQVYRCWFLLKMWSVDICDREMNPIHLAGNFELFWIPYLLVYSPMGLKMLPRKRTVIIISVLFWGNTFNPMGL